MLILKLVRNIDKPLYQQIADQIESLVTDKTLRPGDNLPASRQLATQNGVSRFTVCRAYDELNSRGVVASSSGSYTHVRKAPSFRHINASCPKIPAISQVDQISQNQLIDFEKLNPDPNFIPVEQLRKSFNRAIRKQGADIFGYNDSQGYRPLRAEIVSIMRLHSVYTRPEQILITQGAGGGIELILKDLLKRGKVIVVERPTYSGIIPILKYYKAQVVEVPMTDEGLDLATLEQILNTTDVDLLYTMPNFQNPTGVTTKLTHREQLLEICHKHKVNIIEDGFEEELKYLEPTIPPLKSLDTHDCVYYIGTFSKTIAPGLRVGWVIPPDKRQESLLNTKKIFEHSGNQLSQSVLTEYCSSGEYQKQLKRLHRIYKKRMQLALRLIRNAFPRQCGVSRPMGGYLIWCKITDCELPEQQLIEQFNDAGVQVFSGKHSFFTKSKHTCFRISIANVNEQNIQLGIDKLGTVLHQELS